MKTHGLTKTPTYRVWARMKQRCLDSNQPAYPFYGGRGIQICDRWINSFENFLADMGKRPEGKELDRIDVNGNYEPANCRWATRTEQLNNRSITVRLTLHGETHPLSEWCDLLNLPKCLVRNRLQRGWSHEKTLTTPRAEHYIRGGA